MDYYSKISLEEVYRLMASVPFDAVQSYKPVILDVYCSQDVTCISASHTTEALEREHQTNDKTHLSPFSIKSKHIAFNTHTIFSH